MLQNIVQLIRVKQWIKNLFIVMPLFFAQEIGDLNKLRVISLIFLSFCFITSSIYCFNDIFDRKIDRLHPHKSKRPLASGALSLNFVIGTAIVCLALGMIVLFISGSACISTIYGLFAGYIALNVLYSLIFKHIPILDVIIIASGFVIRILIGGISTSIILSHWIVIMTFLLTLFLALSKRKDDLNLYLKTGKVVRKNIQDYSPDFLNATLVITATATIVAYIMYTVSTEVISEIGNDHVYFSSIFVLAAILKYLQLVMTEKNSKDPLNTLKDSRFLQICILGWMFTFIILIYT